MVTDKEGLQKLMSFTMKNLKTAIAGIICVGMMAAVLIPAPAFAAEKAACIEKANTVAAERAAGIEKANTIAAEKAEHEYVPILMYHNFVEKLPKGGLSATVSAQKFEEDMTWLSENGYTSLLPQEIVAIMDGEMEMPEKPVVVTIDDGYESAYDIAFPVLKKTGMKATVYLIVHGADKPTRNEIEKLGWHQMREMYKSGFMDIQSHTYNMHEAAYATSGAIGMRPDEKECETLYFVRVQKDIAKSIDLIERNLDNKVVSFSYPFGVHDQWGEEILREKGIRYAVGTDYDMADLKGNVYLLSRYVVGEETDMEVLMGSVPKEK